MTSSLARRATSFLVLDRTVPLKPPSTSLGCSSADLLSDEGLQRTSAGSLVATS